MRGEIQPVRAVDLQHAEGLAILAIDDDVDRAEDAVFGQHGRGAEPSLLRQVVGDDRLLGAQRVAGRAGQIRPEHHVADHALGPARAIGDQQVLGFRTKDEHLGKPCLQPAHRRRAGLMQRRVQPILPQCEQPERRDEFLLPQPECQFARDHRIVEPGSAHLCGQRSNRFNLRALSP